MVDSTLLFTGADIALGAGIIGLYGFLWKMWQKIESNQDKINRKLDSCLTRISCLEALHVRRHPEDGTVIESICTEAIPPGST